MSVSFFYFFADFFKQSKNTQTKQVPKDILSGKLKKHSVWKQQKMFKIGRLIDIPHSSSKGRFKWDV